MLQLLVKGKGTIDQSGSGAGRSVLFDGFLGGFLHTGILGQAEVVVRAAHDHFPALHLNLAAPIFFDRNEVGIVSALSSRLGFFKTVTFFEDIHRTPA